MQDAMADMQKDVNDDHDETKAIDDLNDDLNDIVIDGEDDEEDHDSWTRRKSTVGGQFFWYHDKGAIDMTNDIHTLEPCK